MSIANTLRRVGSRLAAKAESVTVTYNTAAAYAPSTGLTAPTSSTTTAGAVVEEYDANEVGSLIEAGDLKVTLSAHDFVVPQPDDTITIDNTVYQVVAVDTLSWGLDSVAYTVQARR